MLRISLDKCNWPNSCQRLFARCPFHWTTGSRLLLSMTNFISALNDDGGQEKTIATGDSVSVRDSIRVCTLKYERRRRRLFEGSCPRRQQSASKSSLTISHWQCLPFVFLLSYSTRPFFRPTLGSASQPQPNLIAV